MKRIAPSERKGQALKDLLEGKGGTADGASMLSQLIRLSTEKVLQEFLEEEQTEYLGRERYERDESTRGRRNGYEERTLCSAEGTMKVQVPQIRDTEHPYRSKLWSSLKKKSEVLEQIVTEMWVRGLSVRDVEQAMESATGAFVLSNSAVSQVTENLYEQYDAFRSRDLSRLDVAYLFIDAVYEPSRRYGANTAVLCAWGICSDGGRTLISLSTGTGESYEGCVEFLRDMVSRGLRPPLTITTDGAPGMTKAVDSMWPSSYRIRCWFHKMQNLEAKVPKSAWAEFKSRVEDARDAPTYEEGKKRMNALIASIKSEFPSACRCLSDDMEASLNHLRVPVRHRPYVRTTNLVERTFVEERRRTKTIPHLWDEKSLEKIVFAVLIRVSERWSKRQFGELEQREIKKLREELGLGKEREDTDPTSKKKRRSAGHVAA